ncbi:MAG: superoxide dismutase [Bacteroidetes bacterium]|nr:superoxide dismutase [Bacteroidota bacterium]MBU1720663.1 superoxide dismutase [Bacteroidota bacterium]
MLFELPKLPYSLDALAPHISRQTLEFHYGKHHQAYVNNLNKMVPGTGFEKANLEDIIKHADGGIFNNGAQVWNHTFYFEGFSPKGGGLPTGELAESIKASFGSFEEFQAKFNTAAGTLFGAGWVWLIKNDDGTLAITQESNAGNPLRKNLKPILTIDVWEHAYYLDVQNRRPDYIGNFWKILDWEMIGERYRR